MKEIWKDIEGYEGLYQISNFGRIIKFLGLRKNSGGYCRIGLNKNRKCIDKFIHRIVLETFIGPPPIGKNDVRHLDGNPSNNRIDNLCWGTRSENVKDSQIHGTYKTPYIKNHKNNTGSKHGMSKLVEKNIVEIRLMYKNGKTIREIRNIFNFVGYHTLYRIVTNKSWKHIQ